MSHRQKYLRALSVQIAACVALGAVSTLVLSVLLGSVLRVSPSGYLGDELEVHLWERDAEAGQGEGRISVDIDRGRGATVIRSRVYGPDVFPQWPLDEERSPEAVLGNWEVRTAVPWLAGTAPWPSATADDERVVLGTGWPWRALSCELSVRDAPDFATHTWSAMGGVLLGSATFPGWASFPPTYPNVVPCRPVWEGLAGNSLLLGSVWWCMLYGPAVARGARRRRANQCVQCGYARAGLAHGSPCPECGVFT